MEAVLDRIIDHLQAQSWQIAVFVLLVALITWILRHRSAHVRYLLWLVVLAKCLVPPVVNVPLPVLPEPAPPIAAPAVPPPGSERPAAVMPMDTKPMPAASPAIEPVRPRLSMRQWMAVVWLAGMGLFTFVAAVKASRTAFWLRRQRQSIPPDTQMAVGSLLSSLGLKRLPRMWLIEGVGQPFVWGLVRGDIYLPCSFLTLTSDEHRKGILGHEIGHVLRFDAAVNILQIFAQAIFWFHPLVWWANKRLRAEREKCCDEMAIARLGTKAKEYSTAIVNTLIQEQASVHAVPSLAIAGPVKNIEERIRTMMRPGKKFYRRPSLAVGVVVGLIALLAVSTALILTARAQTPTTTETTDRLGKTLHQAAADGDLEQIKRLLAKGLDIDTRDEKDMTPLHFAAKEGHKAAVEFLLAKGASINVVEKNEAKPVWLAMANDHRDIVDLLIQKGAKVLPMNLAACFGDTDRVRELIQTGADVNAKETGDSKGRQALHWAVAHGHKDAAELLIENGADVPGRANTMWTPLHVAASNAQREMVELLLAHGAEVAAKARWDYTPLHVALWGKSPDVIEMLLDAGANMYAEDEWGERPVDQVAQGNTIELAALFIAKGMDPNRPSTKSGWTAVHEAACRGSKEVMQLLLSKEVDINRKEKNGLTPIQMAMEQSGSVRTEVVRLLVSHGAEIPPIHAAAYLGDIEKVRALLKSGVDINAQWGDTGTPLCAAAAGNQTDMVKLLLTQGADINAGDDTPLHKAALNGCEEVASLLIDKGADVHAKNSAGYAPIHYAAYHRAAYAEPAHEAMLDLLLSNGADINAKENRGLTSLHNMAWVNKVDLMEFLLARGADIEAKSMWGTTPLFFAVQNGKLGATQLLLSKGANINATDNDGKTPLSIAKEKNNTEMVELLKKHGAKDDATDTSRESKSAKSLHEAAADGDLEQIKRLLAKGLDIDTRDEKDMTPLHLAAKEGHKEVVEFLIAKGADLNARNRRGAKPVWLAMANDHRDVVELLLQKGAKVLPMNLAACFGDTDRVRELIQTGADVNARETGDGKGRQPLHWAVAHGHKDTAELLIKNDANASGRSSTMVTPLHVAAGTAQKEMVKLLLAHDADIAAKGEWNYTPLHMAVWGESADVVEMLIDKRADMYAEDMVGQTPMDIAIASDRVEVVSLFIAKGMDTDRPSTVKPTYKGLHLAASYSSKEVAQFLISQGADVNYEDGNGATPIQVAMGSSGPNQAEIVRLLISHGAEISPIHAAAYLGDIEKVRTLTKEGADVNAKWNSDTPLCVAVDGGQMDIVELLIAKGADVNAGDDSTPLHMAAWHGSEEIARLLIDKGANIHAESSLGFTPVYFAAICDHKAVIDLLLSKGADINAKERRGMTALHHKAWQGNSNMMEFLLARGADIEAKSMWGTTPLFFAVQSSGNWLQTVPLLLSKGANVNATDNNGKTPLSAAKEKGHPELVELLLKHGAKE